jgi:hypothetical protein
VSIIRKKVIKNITSAPIDIDIFLQIGIFFFVLALSFMPLPTYFQYYLLIQNKTYEKYIMHKYDRQMSLGKLNMNV